MNYKKAIEIIQDAIHFSTDELDEALELAYQSLEKQIPKKPNKVFNGIESLAVCECGAEIYMFPRGFKGCPYCLQAIDWSVEE